MMSMPSFETPDPNHKRLKNEENYYEDYPDGDDLKQRLLSQHEPLQTMHGADTTR